MPKTSENGTSARRALRVLKALKGHALDGLSNVELARALRESPVNITRATDILMDEGLVTKTEGGRFVQSILFLQMAEAFARETDQASAKIQELTQRVRAGARR